MLTPGLIAYMCVMYYLKSHGVIANTWKNDEFWWFIIPAVTALCISKAVKIVGMRKENANKAMCVAYVCEVIAIRHFGLLVFNGSFWVIRFFLNLWGFRFGFTPFTCLIFILGLTN